MKVDVAVAGPELRQISSLALLAEDIGFDSLSTAESPHDPFLPLAQAAETTSRIGLGTSRTIPLARSGATLGRLGADLQEYSRGRFVLGLGWQESMRELVTTLRANWAAEPQPYGMPKIYLAGAGGRTAQVAGELADGLFLHGLATERRLRETVVPALETGLRRSGRSWEDIEVVAPAFAVSGTPESLRAIPELLVRRYGALCRRVTLTGPFHQDPGGWSGLVARIHEITCEPVPS